MAGYAESIQTVFLVAVPIAALAFLATWLIPQVELKKWPEAVQPAEGQPALGQPAAVQPAGRAAGGYTARGRAVRDEAGRRGSYAPGMIEA